MFKFVSGFFIGVDYIIKLHYIYIKNSYFFLGIIIRNIIRDTVSMYFPLQGLKFSYPAPMLSYSFFVTNFQIDGIYRQFFLYLYTVELFDIDLFTYKSSI